MLKRSLPLALSLLLVCAACARPASAHPGQAGESLAAAKVKAKVAKLGTGEKACIEVTLLDRRKLRGYVREARDEDFILVHKSGDDVRVPYSQVRRVGGSRPGRGARHAIAISGIFGLLVVSAMLAAASK